MKLLPDAVQCHAQRVIDGSRYAIEQAECDLLWVISSIPMLKVPPRHLRWTRLFIVAGSVVVAFAWSPIMFALTAYWTWASWRNGECHHCEALEGEESYDESEQHH